MKLLATYKNGNYTVKLFDNGTKIRYNNLDNFKPDFAESIDCNISTICNGGCQYCYLNCTENGEHADLTNPIFDTLHAGTELALNANDLSHPDLESFLIKMKNKGIICNLTINQKHLYDNLEKLIKWQTNKLVYGIGISLIDSNDTKLIKCYNKLQNTIIHVIDGCLTKNDLENLSNHNIKLLILGFKHKGRGIDYYKVNNSIVDNNISFLKDNLYEYRHKFNGFAFDNLASDHLNIRQLVGEDKWKTNYMGNEGEFTFYLDAVTNKFAVSSMETTMFDAMSTVDNMFKEVRKIQGFS